jgi:hypothetical protein
MTLTGTALLFVATSVQAQPTQTAVPAAERAVLVELYETTDGPHWKHRAGWLRPPGSECDWEGVQCWIDPKTSDERAPWHVHSISLPDNGLRGVVPSSVGDLRFLEMLFLQGNAITLPESVLKRWDAGELDLRIGTSFSAVSEIRLSLGTNVYCADETIVLRRDGTVSRFRERCKQPRSEKHPKPYCEVAQGRTLDFDRLARFLETRGFFGPARTSNYQWTWVDVPITTISATRLGQTSSIEIGFHGDGSLDEWSFEKAIRGVVETTEWTATRQTKKCPATP